jgi:hypothetical protein
MAKKSFFVGMLAVLLTFGMMIAGCENPNSSDSGSNNNDSGIPSVPDVPSNPGPGDTRATLSAGGAVTAAATATGSAVTFTGATGLTLSAADFAVSSGGAVSTVGVNGGTASVNVTFAANSATSAKTYTVSVAAGSTKIKGSTTVSITQAAAGSTTTTVVNLLNLTGLVIAPVKDNAPGTTAIDTAQYTGIIEWYTGGGLVFNDPTFAANTVYKALVTLSAKPSYTFTGVSINNFVHMSADSVSNGANSGTVTITFPATGNVAATVVSAFNLDGLVTVPVKGNAPVIMPIDATQYTGSIAWYTSGGSGVGSAFAAATVYKALVTLSANPGYTFTGVSQNGFSYTGATTVTNTANSGTVTIIFPATANETGGITVSFGGLPQDETIGLTVPAATLSWVANTPLTVSVGGTFSAYTWYVDGVSLSGQSWNSVTLTAQNYSLGGHTVSVRVSTAGGASYSKTAHFTITQ